MGKTKYLNLLDEARQRIAADRIKMPMNDWENGYNTALVFAMSVIDGIVAKEQDSGLCPTGCEFCRAFDFTSASTDVSHGYAHIVNALGPTSYPRHQQFNYCPVCGKSRYEEGTNGR